MSTNIAEEHIVAPDPFVDAIEVDYVTARHLYQNRNAATRSMVLDREYILEKRIDPVPECFRRLYAKVMVDAAKCYFGNSVERLETREWIIAKNAGPFSFVDTCAVLGLRPDAMRSEFARFMSMVDNKEITKRQLITTINEFLQVGED